MKLQVIRVFVLILSSLFIIVYDNHYLLGSIYFYVLVCYIAINVISSRKIRLIDVWCFAFIFVILSEVFLAMNPIAEKSEIDALKYLIISNNIVLIGYHSKVLGNSKALIGGSYTSKPWTGVLVVLLILLYVSFSYERAIVAFTISRVAAAQGANFVLIPILNALGFVLPAFIVFYHYYIKKRIFSVSFLLALPIFILMFMEGSRFSLLFSVLGFVMTYTRLSKEKFSVSKIVFVSITLVTLLLASNAMKIFRTGSSKQLQIMAPEQKYIDLPTYVSGFMSNEGVIDMTALMFEHFAKHDHLYGSSTSFLLYFWIPRAIWPSKPSMLGYWFVREYRGGFSKGHSASFGFTGELYADFGLFSLLPVFFIGRALKAGEKLQKRSFAMKDYNVILGSMLYPYVFFFVRSPVTSTQTFLGILFFLFILKKAIKTSHN